MRWNFNNVFYLTKIQYLFYLYNTFQRLGSYTWLVATVLDIALDFSFKDIYLFKFRYSHKLQGGAKICNSNNLSKYSIFSPDLIYTIKVTKLNLHGKMWKTQILKKMQVLSLLQSRMLWSYIILCEYPPSYANRF